MNGCHRPVVRMRHWSYVLNGVAVLAVWAGSGCTTPEGRPPIARIVITPAAIIEDDGFQTPVTLDGTRSGDPVDDPGATRPLTFSWGIEGDDVRFQNGTAATPAPVVTFRGDRPATIILTVTDADGLEASAIERVRLTVHP
jgi:hypothetical protein